MALVHEGKTSEIVGLVAVAKQAEVNLEPDRKKEARQITKQFYARKAYVQIEGVYGSEWYHGKLYHHDKEGLVLKERGSKKGPYFTYAQITRVIIPKKVTKKKNPQA